MNFIIYIILFFFVNQLMYFSPILGILCYVAIIVFMFNSQKRRMKSFRNQQGYQGQQSDQNTNQSNSEQFSSQTNTDQQTKNDAIDVEFTEEEI